MLKNEELSPPQSLQILEIILRIIHADNRLDPNEIKFLKIVKSKLKVPNEIFLKRFGDVNYLSLTALHKKEYKAQEWVKNEMKLPDFSQLQTKLKTANIYTADKQSSMDIDFSFNKDEIQ